jgi:hypothetical protein
VDESDGESAGVRLFPHPNMPVPLLKRHYFGSNLPNTC